MTLRPGEMLFVPSSTEHELFCGAIASSERLLAIIDSRYWRDNGLPALGIVHSVVQGFLESLLLYVFERPDRDSSLKLAKMFPFLLLEELKDGSPLNSEGRQAGPPISAYGDRVRTEDARVAHALEVMRSRVFEDSSLEDIAALAGVSKRTLSRILRTDLGLSPHAVWTSLKLEAACEKLRLTELKIIDVAFEAGFASLSSFMESFRRQYGVTPSEYRKRSRILQSRE